MTDLTAFLNARFDEDERAAQAAAEQVDAAEWISSDESGHAWRYRHGGVWGDHDGLCSEAPKVIATDLNPIQRHIARHDPARVLADIRAKRQLLDEGRWVLRLLALPYADHDEYQQEWTP